MNKNKCIFLIFTLTLVFLAVSVFAEGSFQLIISIGNMPPSNLPDYSVLFYVGQPGVPIFIDGRYAGETDIFGQLAVTFSEEGQHIAWAKSFEWYTSYEQAVFFVDKSPKVIYLTPTLQGKLTIFSNKYPVFVYLKNGMLLGKVENDSEPLVVPQGNYDLIFSVPGYNDITKSVSILAKKENPIWLDFVESLFRIELKVVPDVFSPNGDWSDDETTLKIYSSKEATGTIQIKDFSGKILYEKNIYVKPGLTEIVWSGSEVKDGAYTVCLLLSDGKETMSKEARVIVDTSRYTYKKELVLGISAVFLALFGFLIYQAILDN
ncbi:MAG: hypothetical protein WBJ29_03670 [Fervidobacterium sp.]